MQNKKLAALAATMLTVAGLAGCGSSGSSSKASSSGPTNIHFIIDNAGPDFLDVFVAEDQGLFAQQGLKVDVTTATSSAGVAAIRSGGAQFGVLSASEVVDAFHSGSPLIDIADVENREPYQFFVAPSIASPAQLKGARIGITTQGSAVAFATSLALKQMGLSTSDVSEITTGSVANLNSALLAGSVQGGVAHPPASLALQAKGLKVLSDLRQQNATTALSLVATPNTVKNDRALTQKVVNAITAASKLVATNPQDVQEAIKNHVTEVTNPAQIAPTASFYTTMANTPPRPSAADYQTTIAAIAAKDNESPSKFPASQFIDASFVNQASRSAGS